jgi:hypothetical protein
VPLSLVTFLLACSLNRDDFVVQFAELRCAKAIECGSSLDHDACVQQEQMMNDEDLCDYSTWTAQRCLSATREETCEEREARDWAPEVCDPLFRCE